MAVAMLLVGIASDTCGAATDSSIIRVGSELKFEPYAFVDENGQPAGFSVDLIRAVADAMGLSIHISSGTWDSVWNDLAEGRLDALPIVAKLSERTPLVDFSLPHTETYDSFFVRRGDPVIQNIEGAIGKEIVVMRSDAAHHALVERNFHSRLIFVDTIPDGLSLILSGKHDAFLCSKLIGVLAIKKHKLEGLAYGPTIQDYKRVFSFAVKRGDAELLEKLNQGLLIIKASGEYQQIYNKWLSVDDPWRKYEKYLMPIILVVTAVILIGGFWLFMLKRLVSKRTRELAEKNELLRQATEGLEATVVERTDELVNTNTMLKAEITERKHAEDKREQLNIKLKRSNKELEQFAYIASHDLKSPLISISSFADLLKQQYKDKLDRKAHEYIDFIVNSIERMDHLINGMLTHSRIGVSSSKMKPIDVNKIFVRVIANLTVDIEKNKAKITHDSLPTILGYDVQLEQLLQNIIGNAIKHQSQESPRVHLSVKQKGENWVFSVNDNGIGIASENREKIFDMFQCFNRGKYKGTGIGLATCKKIVDLHGGKIWVKSQPNKGATFYFTMPTTSVG